LVLAPEEIVLCRLRRLEQITGATNDVTAMTTTKAYNFLNRLTNMASSSSSSSFDYSSRTVPGFMDVLGTPTNTATVSLWSLEPFTNDWDGNLTGDSLWTNVWNGENRRRRSTINGLRTST
jgi:hypothetical protein